MITIEYNSQSKRYQVKGAAESTLNIPSKMYPLKGKGKIRLFHFNNTGNCNEPAILSCLDKFEPRLGRCYTNAANLANLLREVIDPARVKTYVCWTFIGETRPVHHCITVVDDKYVYDMIPYVVFAANEDDWIGRVAQSLGKYDKVMYGTGWCNDNVCHIARECDPLDAMEQREELERLYPNHQSFRSIHGEYTDIQRKILKAKGKEI